jgi:4-hydroxy-tetrahydrodipicolinate synthase
MFSGAFTAIVTPFRDGEVDEAAFRALIRFNIDGGVSGLVPCGTTGESPTLSHDEHQRVIEIAVKEVAGQVKVIAGTGSNSTDEAISLTRHAKKVGADGALMVSPYYNKPTQEGLFQHYKAVAEAVDIPIIVYNIQGRTAINVENQTMAKLSKLPNIVGVKEASGSILQMSEVIRLCGPEFDVLSGDDQMTFPLMALGGKGVISVVTNIAPQKMVGLASEMLAGNVDAARSIHFDVFELCQTMFVETNPIPVKAALGLMGKIKTEYRLPLCPPSQANLEKIKAVLERYGLI